jgi:hypothetical protein
LTKRTSSYNLDETVDTSVSTDPEHLDSGHPSSLHGTEFIECTEFIEYNDDYVPLTPSFVAARARRAAEWPGEEVLQPPVPLPTELPREEARAAQPWPARASIDERSESGGWGPDGGAGGAGVLPRSIDARSESGGWGPDGGAGGAGVLPRSIARMP